MRRPNRIFNCTRIKENFNFNDLNEKLAMTKFCFIFPTHCFIYDHNRDRTLCVFPEGKGISRVRTMKRETLMRAVFHFHFIFNFPSSFTLMKEVPLCSPDAYVRVSSKRSRSLISNQIQSFRRRNAWKMCDTLMLGLRIFTVQFIPLFLEKLIFIRWDLENQRLHNRQVRTCSCN